MTPRNGMPTHRNLLTLCAVFSWGGASALAQDPASSPAPPAVQIRANSSAVVPIHACGGRPLDFTLVVQAPLGTRTRVYADLVQNAHGAIAATLRRDVPVSAELVFEGCTSMEARCRLPALDAVNRVTSMRLRLRTDPPAARAGGELVLPMTVYPAEEPDTWKKTVAVRLSRAGLRRMAVFGEAKGVRRFLRAKNVAFEDLGGDWPDNPEPGTLYVADLPACATTVRWTNETHGSRWLIFTTAESALLPPGVYQRVEAGGGSVCKVTLPDLFDAPDDHPDRLASLAEIFRLALEPRTTNPTENPP